MAGGIFDINVSKTRPGTYVNFAFANNTSPSESSRGIALIPLVNLGWGPNKEFLKISASSPDEYTKELGHSIYDDNDHMLLLRETLKNATTCIAYVINSGTAATKTSGELTITATYGGTRGNDISITIDENASETFDVSVYLDTEIIESYTSLSTIGDLITASSGNYVIFTGDDSEDLAEVASISLVGGTDGTNTNSDIITFLDSAESIKWNTMAFPLSDDTLHTACISKIKDFRENVGKMVQCVIADCSSDYEGIINVTNSVVVDGILLTNEQATAFVAGITAAATNTMSNTYAVYDGATDVVGIKTHDEAVTAINNGELFFTLTDEETVIIEYDINSLHTFTDTKTSDYCKNRIMRVYDVLAEDLRTMFPPNKYTNTEEGWLLMEGVGQALLEQYQSDGIIQNVDTYNDFYVDQSRSFGDQTYLNIAIQAIDSSEKLYFSVATQ